MTINRIVKIIKEPYTVLFFIIKIIDYLFLIPDKMYLELLFRRVKGKKLNLNNAKSFNEKIQWLKLYDRKPEYTRMVDKYEVKKFVSNIIGEKHIIPTLGIWDEFDEIDFKKLPKQFVLKCTHDSGGLIICKNKLELNMKSSKKLIDKSLKINYYFKGREWVYKNVKPRIIAEKYIVDNDVEDLRDYKFFCFNGKAKFIQVDFNRFTNHKRNIYNTEWQFQNFKIEYPNDPNYLISKPDKLGEMILLANKLSENISSLRVDLYVVKDYIYFGELTFYPGGGFEEITPNEWDYKLGRLIELPENIMNDSIF
tara:strand:+ start:7563 stop:8492 length:930 start_codon:yes stop_codon:yes gene_type:complete